MLPAALKLKITEEYDAGERTVVRVRWKCFRAGGERKEARLPGSVLCEGSWRCTERVRRGEQTKVGTPESALWREKIGEGINAWPRGPQLHEKQRILLHIARPAVNKHGEQGGADREGPAPQTPRPKHSWNILAHTTTLAALRSIHLQPTTLTIYLSKQKLYLLIAVNRKNEGNLKLIALCNMFTST
ncbi:hypothetical protein Pcinc_044124 [Petrolisthes cinctipes]|uniref:Uncharacterized protein n=1 Tax=Petrolisthes cinctipes TaxID=88211 RepID=A0AAE1BHF2_PETCI|nr:hypothetical protein Pcinc_044124 [Petrolisthes cinctipes]